MIQLQENKEKLEKLNISYRRMQNKYGDKSLDSVLNGGKIDNPNICFVFTEWPDMKQLTPAEFKSLMHTPLVYDGRNLYSPEDMKAAGVEYYSIGR